jgi:exodeoxyribonuclease V alpha subunit
MRKQGLSVLTDLQGQIERITYFNEENGYTVAKVKVHNRRDLVTVVGTILTPTPGEELAMQGEWVYSPRYGAQFKVVQYTTIVPASVSGIEKYLGSGLIKGIGPVMAKRIVKQFGQETLAVIEHDSGRLTEVEGIGDMRVQMIRSAWTAQKEIREVMIFLQSQGVSSGYATKIFRQYKEKSIEVVKANPYRLATDIFGIGFITADKIAERLGVAKNSELRAEAGILYVLNQLSEEGHVYYPYELLIRKCRDILEVEREIIEKAFALITADNRAVIEELHRGAGDEAGETRAVYLARYYFAETGIAAHLKSLINAPASKREADAAQAVEWVQGQLSLQFADRQKEAISNALEHKVMVITGGPGTGKTTIINAILKIFARAGARILLGAPTGRAAKRMSEVTGHDARTIHRMLKYSVREGGFEKNETNPLDGDLIIIDEVSMIDTLLMHHLLRAIPVRATLILVGDVNQLPSVGAGSILKDIIDSGAVPVVELNEIFRQAQESLIIVNAHRINNGVMPILKSPGEKREDFYFIQKENPEEVLKLILELVTERIPKRFQLHPVDDIQVLTPMHRGTVGAENLNLALRQTLNPREDGVTRGGRNFRVNDKVMQVRNNYDKDVFNGDIGRIVKIDAEMQEATIAFDGRTVAYDFPDLDEIILAYAISVHKSQGSEYPAVVIPLLTQHYVLLQKNLIYTAVTRGKNLVVIIGTKKALAIGVKNNKTEQRFTSLRYRLG